MKSWFVNLRIGFKLSAFGAMCAFGMLLIILAAAYYFGQIETVTTFKEEMFNAVHSVQDVRTQEKTYLQFYLPQYRQNLETDATTFLAGIDVLASSAPRQSWRQEIAVIKNDFSEYLSQFKDIVSIHDRTVDLSRQMSTALDYCYARIDSILLSINKEQFELQMEGKNLPPNKLEMLSVSRDCKIFLLKLLSVQQLYLMTGDDHFLKEFNSYAVGKDAAALATQAQFASSFKDKELIRYSKEFKDGVTTFRALAKQLQELYKDDKSKAKRLDDIGNKIIKQAQNLLGDATASVDTTKKIATTTIVLIVSVTILLCFVLAVLLIRSITKPLDVLVDYSQAVAAGKYATTLRFDRTDEVGALGVALQTMVQSVKSGLDEVKLKKAEAEEHAKKAEDALLAAEHAGEMAAVARREGMLDAAVKLRDVVKTLTGAFAELSGSIESSTKGVGVQEQRVGTTVTAMEQMNATVAEVAQNASTAAKQAANAREKADSGEKVVVQAISAITRVDRLTAELEIAMGDLGGQVQSIGHIMSIISDIADQTNLLALNAAIEAARAGEAGRGFAVVADEVRKLAEKTMSATQEVAQAITAIQTGSAHNAAKVKDASGAVGEATRLASQSGTALREIVVLVDDTSDQVARIAVASERQALSSKDIICSVEGISQVSSDIAVGMRESSAALEHLAEQTYQLEDLIASFQNGEGNSSRPRALSGLRKSLPRKG